MGDIIMTKLIISGSIAFQTEYQKLANTFVKKGYQVIDYPKASNNLTEEYPSLFVNFYKNIETADVFYLFNKEKNGIPGYIGAAGFSETTYALCQNLIDPTRKESKISSFALPVFQLETF